MDRFIASDLSYEVAQFRREHPELASSGLDSTNQTLHAITPCVFDSYAADRESISDSFQGEAVPHGLVPDQTLPRLAYRSKSKR